MTTGTLPERLRAYAQNWRDRDINDPVITDAAARIEALESDARRYKWLRLRVRVKSIQAANLVWRSGMDIRFGHTFFDVSTVPGSGYLDQEQFKSECIELDAAIDAALEQKS